MVLSLVWRKNFMTSSRFDFARTKLKTNVQPSTFNPRTSLNPKEVWPHRFSVITNCIQICETREYTLAPNDRCRPYTYCTFLHRMLSASAPAPPQAHSHMIHSPHSRTREMGSRSPSVARTRGCFFVPSRVSSTCERDCSQAHARRACASLAACTPATL